MIPPLQQPLLFWKNTINLKECMATASLLNKWRQINSIFLEKRGDYKCLFDRTSDSTLENTRSMQMTQ